MDERKSLRGYYEAVRKTFYVSRVTGYMPIIGLLNENSKGSRCVWMSMYSIYYGINFGLSISFMLIHLYHAIFGRGFRDIEGLLFRCFEVVTNIFVLRLCVKWEKTIKDVEVVERLLPPLKNPNRIFRSINFVLLLIVVSGFVNHCIHLMLTFRMVTLFYIKEGVEFSFEIYYKSYYRWIFDNVSFSYVTALLFQFSKLQMAFSYLFIDSIVIVVTMYLLCRFKNFNRMVKNRERNCLRNKNVLWMDLQAHYTRLGRLVKIIDDHVNPFVFLSFFFNLILICKNIYDSIQLRNWLFIRSNWIIVLESLAKSTFLVIRISSVSILTAHLHTLSREPLKLLHTLPASAYTLELQRFMDQVYQTKIHLSGMGLFYITRGTILSMISNIITYELVLLDLPVMY